MIKYIPNILTILRILLAIPLFITALAGNRVAFVLIFVIGKVTDVLDGYIARKFNCTSELGSKLDSYSDIIFDLTSFASFFLIEPLVYKDHESIWFIGFGSLVTAWIYGWVRTGKLMILHLYTNKAFGILYTLYLFLAVVTPPLYFLLYLSVSLGVLASLEQIYIFHKYPKYVIVEVTSFLDKRLNCKRGDK